MTPTVTTTTDVNPLREALPRTRVPDPCAVVLFGATGDLTHRKLVPALYHLGRGGNMPSEYAIVGFARRDWTDENLQDELATSLKKTDEAEFDRLWPEFAKHIAFSPGTFDDPKGYHSLKEKLEALDKSHGTRGNRLLLSRRRTRVFQDDYRTSRQGRIDLCESARVARGAGSSSRSRSATT